MTRKPSFRKPPLALLIATLFASFGSAQAITVPVTKRSTEKNVITPQKQQAVAAERRAAGTSLTTTVSTATATAAAPASLAVQKPGPGGVPRYFSHPNYANSPLPMGTCSTTTAQVCFSDLQCPQSPAETCVVDKATGIPKFVDKLAGLGSGNENNLGHYIPVATPGSIQVPSADGGTVTADYYEIELVEYSQQMHTNLPPTKLRGYRQVGSSKSHYLGPVINATKDRPVVIKFFNKLDTGAAGNLFLPVDTTVMGAGMGPQMGGMEEMDPQRPMCGGQAGENAAKMAGCYTENRATLHLHGGVTPWISDGTPHQWITPAGETTAYPEGVSVQNVPGLNLCTAADDGCQTFYYTNQQSARLLFYHDHSWGITRLNVYAGEAAPYLITDKAEEALLAGPLANLAATIPLVIQDKTFVPDATQLALQDETWDSLRWGGKGSLWLPHVYSPAQNPGDSSGVNLYGRWAYGPWFWPPVQDIKYGPIANPYFDQNCIPDKTWCEPSLMPGTPYLSMGMESFHDTPVVNGTAYPYVEVPAGPVRFRILNGSNDRFWNLSLYKADASGTEVTLNSAEVAAAKLDPAGVFPTPDAAKGPDWIQIGTEGGFLPAPVVIPAQHITWVTDPTVFNAGNVDKHSLLLGPAERADVIVDFSAYGGQTLILYNDAPAAFPARDPRYDYYTDNADLTDTGGAPTTLPGYGPNTRTVMQIRVGSAKGSINLTDLNDAFKHKTDGSGIFESAQNPIIVGQGAYNSAYGTSFQENGPAAGLVNIHDSTFSFKTLAGGADGAFLTFGLKPKMIQDEMGEAFEREYGRMSGNLGVETPNAQAGLQNMILYAYDSPPTEILKGLAIGGPGIKVSPITTADDGTQIWKITHNGVDTHPIHFHLYDVQLINRVGWDGAIRKPDANELGWKDTVRISPLEDTIVALRPILPKVPFQLPNSVRLLNPAMPEGFMLADSTAKLAAGLPITAFNPDGEPIDIVNHKVNFGNEYVWHCHILSHEEMDMMRSQVVGVAPLTPTDLAVTVAGGKATVTWKDNSVNETAFVLQRANDSGFVSGLNTRELPADTTTYVDSSIKTNTAYYYRVLARNRVGDTWDYANPALNNIPAGSGFPTLAVDSEYSAPFMIGKAPTAPLAPSNLTTALLTGPQVKLTWRDNSNNESGFVIERSANGGAFARLATVGANINSYVDSTVQGGNAYSYQVQAINASGASSFAATPSPVSVPLVKLPLAPSNLAGTAVRSGANAQVTLTWTDNADNENGFEVQQASNLNFTTGLVTRTTAANTTGITMGKLTRNAPYYFRVRAFNSAGNSTWGNILILTTP